jgi:predicted DNA-binding transcriptional regulator AlpA
MRLVRYPQLRELYDIPYSRVHLGRMENVKQFPRRIHLSRNVICWSQQEIEDWIKARADARTKAAA